MQYPQFTQIQNVQSLSGEQSRKTRRHCAKADAELRSTDKREADFQCALKRELQAVLEMPKSIIVVESYITKVQGSASCACWGPLLEKISTNVEKAGSFLVEVHVVSERKFGTFPWH